MKPAHFVTNFNPYEVDEYKLLRVAKLLDLYAWVGYPIKGFGHAKGFYVHKRHNDLSQFWSIINENSIDDG